MARIVVGMSGGVDSSVAALLLKNQGHDVTGVFMKNWEDEGEDGVCAAAADYQDVRSVCDAIGIPYYSVNFAKEYKETVFAHFLDEYARGRTPNPDLLCNKEIKFCAFLDYALRVGADYIATGHFARVKRGENGVELLKAIDSDKDQTYFLSLLKQSQLERAIFPVGHLTKREIRAIAAENGLSTSDKKDSTGICFIGERDFKSFLSGYLPAMPGDMRLEDGTVVGRHDGVMYYTIGQRRGLGLGGAGEKWVVISKDADSRVLTVARGEHPSLYSRDILVSGMSWISGKPPANEFAAQARIRHRQEVQPCRVELGGETAVVRFETPQRAAAPGQYAVFYNGDVCLGAAVIERALKPLAE